MRQHPKGKSELLPYVCDFVPFIIENIFFDYMDRNKGINTESQHRKQFLPSYCSKQFIMICLIAGMFFPCFYCHSSGEANVSANPCISSNSKAPSASGSHPHYMGWRLDSMLSQLCLPPISPSMPAQTHHTVQHPHHKKSDGGEKAPRPCLERCCLYPSMHSVLLFRKTNRDNLMMVTLAFNNAADCFYPWNSMPEKVQQNMFWRKLICLHQIWSLQCNTYLLCI